MAQSSWQSVRKLSFQNVFQSFKGKYGGTCTPDSLGHVFNNKWANPKQAICILKAGVGFGGSNQAYISLTLNVQKA